MDQLLKSSMLPNELVRDTIHSVYNRIDASRDFCEGDHLEIIEDTSVWFSDYKWFVVANPYGTGYRWTAATNPTLPEIRYRLRLFSRNLAA